jgi:hypothetical protein
MGYGGMRHKGGRFGLCATGRSDGFGVCISCGGRVGIQAAGQRGWCRFVIVERNQSFENVTGGINFSRIASGTVPDARKKSG